MLRILAYCLYNNIKCARIQEIWYTIDMLWFLLIVGVGIFFVFGERALGWTILTITIGLPLLLILLNLFDPSLFH